MGQVFARLVLEQVRRHSRTPWLLVGLLALVAGSWVTVTLGQRDYDEQMAAYADRLQARLQEQLRGTGHALGRGPEAGLRVIRRPGTGTVLVQGENRLLPAAWEVTPAGAEALPPYVSTGQRSEGAGVWDLEALVRVMGGILALALGTAGVVGDRLSGWSAVLSTLPVSRGMASLARISGGGLALALLVVVWWLAVVLMLAGTSAVEAMPLWRVWLLAVPTLLYLWALFGIGATLAWLIRPGFKALFLGVAAWLFIAVLGPAAVPPASQIVVPVAPQAKMERDRREQFADDMRAAEQKLGRDLLARLPSSAGPAELGVLADSEFARLAPEWQAAVGAVRARARGAEREWRRHLDRQRRVASWMEWGIPGMLAQAAMAELMDTGRSNVEAWETAVGVYQAELDDALFDDRPTVNLRLKGGAFDDLVALDRHEPPRFGDLPTFTPPDRQWAARGSALQSCGVGLVLWAIAALAGAWLAGVRWAGPLR